MKEMSPVRLGLSPRTDESRRAAFKAIPSSALHRDHFEPMGVWSYDDQNSVQMWRHMSTGHVLYASCPEIVRRGLPVMPNNLK